MLTYWEARSAERFFTEYKDLARQYWDAKPPVRLTGHEWMSGQMPDPQSDESLKLRQKVNASSIEASRLARMLGVPTIMSCAAWIGGPLTHKDLLDCVVDRRIGCDMVTANEVTDALDKCIGAARSAKDKQLWKQALNPLYYLIQGTAFVIRIPFLVLEQAGLPEEVENTLWAHIVKGATFLALAGVLVHYGFKFSLNDLIGFFK